MGEQKKSFSHFSSLDLETSFVKILRNWSLSFFLEIMSLHDRRYTYIVMKNTFVIMLFKF